MRKPYQFINVIALAILAFRQAEAFIAFYSGSHTLAGTNPFSTSSYDVRCLPRVCSSLKMAAEEEEGGQGADKKNPSSERKPWPVGRFARTLYFFQKPKLEKVARQLSEPVRRRLAPGQGQGQQGQGGGSSQQAQASRGPAPPAELNPDRGAVLVTGATGGVGKRVADGLMKKGVRVRALVRNKSKALAYLCNGKEPSPDSLLEIVVGDLTKVESLKASIFRGVQAAVLCHAAIVKPQEGDGPDRAKYFQGIQFYEPEMVDKPMDIDFKGTCNIVEGLKKFGSVEGKVLYGSSPGLQNSWRQFGSLDDVVMGGISKSSLSVVPGAGEEATGSRIAAVFSGEVSTDNNGGFASVRTRNLDPPLDLSSFDGIEMRLKGDGNRYKLMLRDETRWDGISWCYSFDTEAGKWMDVRIPFKDFIPTLRSNSISGGPQLRTTEIYAFQITLSKFEYDGSLNPNFTAGSFSLVLDSIKAYERVSVPRVIYLSSAGVTRPGRPGIQLDQEPPAVRMNDALGGILTAKLKGEDCLRDSGLPYCVMRPCALTEEPRGAPLVVEQGDNMKGKISRESVAEAVIAALQAPDAKDKTFEIKSNVPFSEVFQTDENTPLLATDFPSLFADLSPEITGK